MVGASSYCVSKELAANGQFQDARKLLAKALSNTKNAALRQVCQDRLALLNAMRNRKDNSPFCWPVCTENPAVIEVIKLPADRLRKNIKNHLLPVMDKLLLRKRAIIVIDYFMA